MTNTRSLIWDLSWGIDYRAKLGPYRPPTSFKHRVQKCDLKCTWPVIGYTRIWYTGKSFLLKRLTGLHSLSPLTYSFVVVFFPFFFQSLRPICCHLTTFNCFCREALWISSRQDSLGILDKARMYISANSWSRPASKHHNFWRHCD